MEESGHNKELLNLFEKAVKYFKKKYLNPRKEFIQNFPNNDTNEQDFGIVHVYSHLDADGLSAASILASALKAENIGFQVTILKQLEEQYFESEIIKSSHQFNQFLIFTDFGSGQLNLFEKYLINSDFIILDHHEPLTDDNGDLIKINGFHINPYFANVNGSEEISGAGMAYLFALTLNSNNIKLSSNAIIGAVGDIQNKGPQSTLRGENKAILKDAVDSNLIEVETEPAMIRSKALPYSLAYTLPIKIDEIHGDFKKAEAFLNRIGIILKSDLGEYRNLADLSRFDKKKLTSELVQLALRSPNFEPNMLDDMIQTNYLLKEYEDYPSLLDSKDLSKMLNACGRLNKPSIGLFAIILKNKPSIKKAIDLSEEYTKIIRESIKWVTSNKKILEKKSIQYFYGEDKINENIIGIICSNLSFSKNINQRKPIIGYADTDSDAYKVSARCSDKLLEFGVNLSTAIRDVCDTLGIDEKGGGHPPASGAKIPRDKIDQFIIELDKKIAEQKKEGKKGKLDAFGVK